MARSKRKADAGGSFGRRGVAMAPTHEEARRRRWPITLGALGIFVVALFVRFYGLSHDLDEGNVYHPDTPKQIDAAERFLRGHYYFKTKEDFHDIDGYPYFSMHLVEYEWRGISGVHSLFRYLMGWRRELTQPYEYADLDITLFVVARLSVCVLSALAVLVVYRIGLETWGPLVGLLGAGLAAVSWLTVETAHYAMPDAIMDLFVCLTVLVALRMYRSERLVYPLLAGVLAALSFATKYNGGIVLLVVLLLHVLKYASPRRLFSRRALGAAGLIAAGTLIGVVGAIPSLLIYPDRVVKGIMLFSRYASQFRDLPPELAESRWALFRYAAGANFSIVLRAAGPVMLIGAAAGFVASVFRNRRHVLPALFILVYGVALLAGARQVKAYYFSVVMLFLGLYVAVATDWLVGLRRWLRIPGVAVGTALAAVVLIIGAVHVARSDFFFWHMSSRRVATAWVNENIPELFRVEAEKYTLYGSKRSEAGAVETLAIATGSIHKTPPPENAKRFAEFRLEGKGALTSFRNPTVLIWLFDGSSNLRADFSMPVYQRIPSETGNRFVFPLGPEFLRSGRFVSLHGRATRRIFVIPEPAGDVVIALRNGDIGNLVTLSFGGQEHSVALRPLETKIVTVRGARRVPLIGRPFYKFWARAPFACQAEVAVSDEQKGALYYNASRYEEALPHLVAARRKRPRIALAQMAAIAAACSGQDLGKLDGGAAVMQAVRDDLAHPSGGLFERFGVSSLYVENLPYIGLEAEDLLTDEYSRTRYARSDPGASGDMCVVPGADLDSVWAVHLANLFLEPGAYRVILSARMTEPVRSDETKLLAVSFIDTTGQIRYARAVLDAGKLVGPAYRDVECSLRLNERLGPVTLEIAADPELPLRIDRITIKPDAGATVEARDRLTRAILDGNVADLEPDRLHFEPLLAYARNAEVAGDVERALAAYEKAAEADAESYRPYEGMRRILDRLPDEQKAEVSAKLDEAHAAHALPPKRDVSVRFKNGAVLSGYRLSASEYKPGETIGMTLYWTVAPESAQRFAGRCLFIHFIPAGAPRDRQVFQGDTALVNDFGFDERLDCLRPVYRHRIQIPDDVAPGEYDIEVGILIEMHNKRIRVVEADVPHTNNSATIGSVTIEPREGPRSSPD
jgi:hypothetical protein